MSGNQNMATRIETGETTVEDKWRIIRIILYCIGGALLIGFGLGYLF
jgi:hypothetical protein